MLKKLIDLNKITVGDNGDVFYNGVECKQIGSGAYRTVYKIPDINLVVKRGTEWANDMEWDSYKKVKRSGYADMVAKTYKPFERNGESVVIQEFIEGKIISKAKATLDLAYRWKEMRRKIRMSDMHDRNIIVEKKTGRLVLIDMGNGRSNTGKPERWLREYVTSIEKYVATGGTGTVYDALEH